MPSFRQHPPRKGSLFAVDGLIRAWVCGTLKGICHSPSVVHHAYLRWLVTQDGSFEALPDVEKTDDAQRSRQFGDRAANDSKGFGTVMRDASFGVFRCGDLSLAFTWAVESAWTTHGRPSARYSSGALAAIVAHIVKGEDLPTAISRALMMLPGEAEAGKVRDALARAVDLSRAPDWRTRLPELGKGWVAEEAFAVSVLCALGGTDVPDAVVAAVNHSGDSDSTGTITGNTVGAIKGASVFPSEWIGRVELRDVIETLSRDLVATLDEDHDSEMLAKRLWDRYPGW